MSNEKIKRDLLGRKQKFLPKWFTDSIVCWYDPSRQGCTNENMNPNSETNKGNPNFKPLLKDLSGNGVDLNCYNFSWTSDSGIDNGFGTNLDNWRNQTPFIFKVIRKNNKFIVNTLNTFEKTSTNLNIIKTKDSIINQSVKITGISKGYYLDFDYNHDTVVGFRKDGIYKLPNCEKLNQDTTGFAVHSWDEKSPINIIIEFIPNYKNSINFDGIDDYCETNNAPILKDFTLILNKENYTVENPSEKFYTSKSKNVSYGAFILGENQAWSFGKWISGLNLRDNNLLILTKNYINNTPLNVGENPDQNYLYIGGIREDDYRKSKFRLYSYLLFNRTLTQDEIDWVKYKIMGEELPKPIAAWSAKGKTNEDPDKNILKDLTGNGHDITLHNFAFGGNSGYGKYNTDFNNWYNAAGGKYKMISSNKIIINSTSGLLGNSIIYNNPGTIKELKFYIRGLENNILYLRNRLYEPQVTLLTINRDGFYSYKFNGDYNKLSFSFQSTTQNNECNITIELIPEYPEALCFDGIDDYGICDNMPLFTPEKGYTVILKSFMSEPFNLRSWVISKSFDAGKGAFRIGGDVYTFGNNALKLNSTTDCNGIVYETSKYFNRTPLPHDRNGEDNKYLWIGSLRDPTITSYFWKGAFYEAHIFDHDLTPKEIEFYIQDNIDPDYVLPKPE